MTPTTKGDRVPDARVPTCLVCGMYDQQVRESPTGKLVGKVQVSRVRVEIGDLQFVGNLCEIDRRGLVKAVEGLPEGEHRRRRRTVQERIRTDAPPPAVKKAASARQKPAKGPERG